MSDILLHMAGDGPPLAFAAVILQAAVAGVMLLVWLALVLLGSARIAALLAATLVCGIPLAIFTMAAWGLLKRTGWAWTFSIVADSLAVILACRLTYEERSAENIIAIALFGAPLLVLALPHVRRYFRPPVKKGVPHIVP